MTIPVFRYHPDPIASGSVISSDAKCRCCGKARGFIYVGPAYAEDEVEPLCPWCIADGSAHKKFDVTFTDSEAIGSDVPEKAADEICQRTPGYDSWQSGAWPGCCGDGTRYLAPVGHAELQTAAFREWLGSVLNHIIYNMQISGGAATRLLQSLSRDVGPTAYLFECIACGRHHVHIDRT